MNNARKHAQAEQIVIRFYQRESNIVVEIEDNGVGFDVGAVDANYDQRGSLGMINMRERTELIEGTLRIQSAKGRGTKISILIPIHESGAVGDGNDSEPAPPLELQSQRTGIQRINSPSNQPTPAAPTEAAAALPRPSRPQPPRALKRIPTQQSPSAPPRTANQPGVSLPDSRPEATTRPPVPPNTPDNKE